MNDVSRNDKCNIENNTNGKRIHKLRARSPHSQLHTRVQVHPTACICIRPCAGAAAHIHARNMYVMPGDKSISSFPYAKAKRQLAFLKRPRPDFTPLAVDLTVSCFAPFAQSCLQMSTLGKKRSGGK